MGGKLLVEGMYQSHGECGKMLVEYSEPVSNNPNDNHIVWGHGGGYESISFGENFGCIHFQPK